MSNDSDSPTRDGELTWYKALSPDELPDGRVTAASCGDTTVAVTHYDGEYAALDNNCPNPGGPLGEGSTETGIYVGFPAEEPHERTVSDVIAETLVNWGVRQVPGIVGHSNPGLADALRREADHGNRSYYGVRHEGAAAFGASAHDKLTGRPAACSSIAGHGARFELDGIVDLAERPTAGVGT